MSDPTHAYVSRRPCGHPVELAVDDPDDTSDTARHVAAAIRAGYTVERVTIEEARQIGIVYCDCAKAEPIARRTSRKPDRRQVERRADKRRLDDKSKARIKR